MTSKDKQTYYKNYYTNIKEKKIIFCETCKLDVIGYNIYKHFQSLKHCNNLEMHEKCKTEEQMIEFKKYKKAQKKMKRLWPEQSF